MPATPLFRCGDETWTSAMVVAAAEFLGLTLALRQRLIAELAAASYAEEEAFSADAAQIQEALDEFRYQRDLLTEEETEHWLERWAVSLDDLTDFLDRRHWHKRFAAMGAELARDYAPAILTIQGALWPEAVFDGAASEWAVACARRAAAGASRGAAPLEDGALQDARDAFYSRAGIAAGQLSDWLRDHGRDEAWFERMVALDACAHQVRQAALSGVDLERELLGRRLDLTLLTLERAVFPTVEAAREAMLCVVEDRDALSDAARRAGVGTVVESRFLEDFPGDVSRRCLSAIAGELLGPVAVGEVFELWSVVARQDPDVRDERVRRRLEQLVERSASDRLVAAHVSWLLETG